MNGRLEQLSDYPFARLARLKEGIVPPDSLAPIDLALGEPKHATPAFIRDALVASLSTLQVYPMTRGLPELRIAIMQWLGHRYGLPEGSLHPDRHILPCNGSREALFSMALATVDAVKPMEGGALPIVVMPNPFYQIYEGAAVMAGAEGYFVNATEKNGFLPDYHKIPEDVLKRTQLLYVCSPGNPTGAVADISYFQGLIEMAHHYGFVIASDECYSEIYDSKPPTGLLQAAWSMGTRGFERCLIFQSLSKRSNIPGARSGFIAGDADLLQGFLRLRIYMGGATPYFVQHAAIAAWSDEAHVEENRRLYREKMNQVCAILSPAIKIQRPEGGFYLWLPVGEGETFAQKLYQEEAVSVLPGAYLSRPSGGIDPGKAYVRIALVAPLDSCCEAAERIQRFMKRHPT